MRYRVEKIDNQKLWEDFCKSYRPTSFLQSWAWREFNENLGRKTFPLGIFEGENLKSIALFIKEENRLGSYLYCPRGPVGRFDAEILSELLIKLKEIAKLEGSYLIKIDPLLKNTPEHKKIFKSLGFLDGVIHIQAEDVQLIPLEKPEEEIFSAMRETTRRWIKREQKAQVKVEKSNDAKDAQLFAQLILSIARRKKFRAQPKIYFIRQIETLTKYKLITIFKSFLGDKLQAVSLVVFYGDTAYYIHGSSTPESARPVAYLLHWEAIKEAKRCGLKYYDLSAVLKEEDFEKSNPWYGITFFKKGFGGFTYSFLKSQDYPTKPIYYFYRASQLLRTLQKNAKLQIRRCLSR